MLDRGAQKEPWGIYCYDKILFPSNNFLQVYACYILQNWQFIESVRVRTTSLYYATINILQTSCGNIKWQMNYNLEVNSSLR